MKRILALVLILSVFLTGCSLFNDVIDGITDADTAVDEDSSVVKFNVYPDQNDFKPIGKFDRPEYKALSEEQQRIYILLDNAVFNMQTGFIELGECSSRDIELAYLALTNDRPEYFWVPKSYKTRSLGERQEICFAEASDGWFYTESERKSAESKIKSSLESFLKTVDKADSEYTRELKAHDWLCEKITYDRTALTDFDKYFDAWTVAGAFIDGKAVCEGYSRAMQLLMYMTGIECSLVTGTTEDSHMWNTVKIDGKHYHVDVTSDDGAKYGTYHFFFNVTTDYLKKSRTVFPLISSENESFDRYNTYLPKCTELDANYHVVNSQYISSKSTVESTVVSLICDAVRSGQKSVEFAVSPDMGFVFGDTDAAKFFNLEHCIAVVNSELSDSQRIRQYSYGGVNGALGFKISW